MNKLTFGVGVNDLGYRVHVQEEVTKNGGKKIRKSVFICRYYAAWKSMLRRCYSKKYLESNPTYIGTSVCNEWLYATAFKKWMEQQDWRGKCLDKDIIAPGSKLYSPDTCAFVLQATNSFVIARDACRGDYPIGVDLFKPTGKYRAHCNNHFTGKVEHLGLFSTPEEAHEAWRKRKHELAQLVAATESDLRVVEALRKRYSFEEWYKSTRLTLVSQSPRPSGRGFTRKLYDLRGDCMSHINYVIKRDGNRQAFSTEKLEHWAQWAVEELPDVDWHSVVESAWRKCSDGCCTQDLQQSMIDACVVDNASTSHQLLAGRLFIGNLWHEMFGKHWNIPTVKQWHQELVQEGLVEDLTACYTNAQWEEIESIIDHKRDLHLKYSQCVQIVGKYALKDVATKRVFETPQLLFMRQALWHASKYEPERRMELLKDFYDYMSKEIVCEPTPSSLYTGTVKGTIPSCVVLRAGDDLKELGTVMQAIWETSANGSGIGVNLETRAPKDPIRRLIEHNGKQKYFAAMQALADANQQAGRSGAVTSYYTCLDPELAEIASWKNPTTVAQKRLPNLDFAFVANERFVNAVEDNSEWMLISCLHAPELWEAMYDADQTRFNELYDMYDNNVLVKKTYVNARDVLHAVLKETVETRQFLMFSDEMNRHTPFKEKIYSSNLCVAPETKILTRDGYQVISTLKDKEVDVWNGNEWSTVTVRKTGENQKLLKVVLSNGMELECTPYHKFYLDGKEHPVECLNLPIGAALLDWYTPQGEEVTHCVFDVIDTGRYDDTYCFNEPLQHMGVFNGILTGQCMEIGLPTKPFKRGVQELFDSNAEGEIATCNLMAINVANATVSDEVYERACYLSLLMVRNNILYSNYPFPSMKEAAIGRMSAGISMISMAHLMAKEGLAYDSLWGKKFIARLAETHSYFLHKTALRIGKEYGNAPWINRTKYPDGWLPIDTAHPNAQKIAHQPLKRDWEPMRKEIVENGGVAFSVLETSVPSESSSMKQDATNGLYPIRDGIVLKKDGKKIVQWIAPEWEKLKDNYQSCWAIPTSDMIDVYAIVQMFTGQAISADFWMSHRKDEQGKIKVSGTQLMKDYIEMKRKGMKTRYYVHHQTNGVYVQNDDTGGCSSGGCKL